MKHPHYKRIQEAWGELRFSVVGQLLASPPPHGQLQNELTQLAEKKWKHPTKNALHRFSVSTIEGWYYKARRARQSPVLSLNRKARLDRGTFRQLSQAIRNVIAALHEQHPGWSHQLQYDNLLVIAKKENLGDVGSYSTVRRYRKAMGFTRAKLPRNADRAGVVAALCHLASREQRSFEASHVHGLWHSDIHHCSRKLLTDQGEWAKPVLIAVMDDRSRLVCHAQWYWQETAENFVHTLTQAILKRGLPRSLLTDNGSPMLAGETTQGLARLGVLHHTTLPYSPQQNGKQECFWGQIEGRVIAMLEGELELTIKQLNEATQAWVEMEYHRKRHSETLQTPLERLDQGPDVGRPSPSTQDLRLAFTIESSRVLRRSDISISLDAVRYEIPSAYRHLKHIHVRYASWDLSQVHMIDRHSGKILCRILPRDLEKNADRRRRAIEVQNLPKPKPTVGIAPLLANLIDDYKATGLPMGYLAKDERKEG